MPNRSSLWSNNSYKQAIKPATLTADTNGSAIDLQGYDDVCLTVNVGVAGDTLSGSVKWEFEVQHGDQSTVLSACADTDLTKAVTGTNTGTFAVVDSLTEDETTYQTGYIGNKRYVRVVVNATGTHTNGTPIGATAILGRALNQPVNS